MRKGDLAAIIDLNEKDDQTAIDSSPPDWNAVHLLGVIVSLIFPLSSLDHANVLRSVAIFLPKSGRSVTDHIRSGSTWNMDQITGGVFTYPYMAGRDYEARSCGHGILTIIFSFCGKAALQYTIIMGTKMSPMSILMRCGIPSKAGESP